MGFFSFRISQSYHTYVCDRVPCVGKDFVSWALFHTYHSRSFSPTVYIHTLRVEINGGFFPGSGHKPDDSGCSDPAKQARTGGGRPDPVFQAGSGKIDH